MLSETARLTIHANHMMLLRLLWLGKLASLVYMYTYYGMQMAVTKQFPIRNCIRVQGLNLQRANRATYLRYFFGFNFASKYTSISITDIDYTDYTESDHEHCFYPNFFCLRLLHELVFHVFTLIVQETVKKTKHFTKKDYVD